MVNNLTTSIPLDVGMMHLGSVCITYHMMSEMKHMNIMDAVWIRHSAGRIVNKFKVRYSPPFVLLKNKNKKLPLTFYLFAAILFHLRIYAYFRASPDEFLPFYTQPNFKVTSKI
ncbi:GATA transcription factor 9 [Striga asiatica]|uniref:GATA transcription factor 9 n=1 Tax=Striga asiatica TaxID=4170 RepID=A0A5A7NZ12_STRAF|nr:GATA transcription factor 9 [Striga asiatica]